MARPSGFQAFTVVLAATAVLVAYVGVNTKFTFQFSEIDGFLNFDMLAEAFVSGQLHLNQQVDSRRIESEDPRDPSLPYPFLPDAIILKGKYYFYHGPLPGLIHALWTGLSGRSCPSGVVVVAAVFGSFLGLGGLLYGLRGNFFPDSPLWTLWYVWLSYAFSSIWVFMVSRPVIYHESIACGVFFLVAGSALLIHALNSEQSRYGTYLLSGTMCSAAIACRFTLLLYPLCFIGCLLCLGRADGSSRKVGLRRILIFMAPLVGTVGCLLFYNYLRFGDPGEFGVANVVLGSYDSYEYLGNGSNYARLGHVPYNVFNYVLRVPFLGQPDYQAEFPKREHLHSVFLMAPVLLLCLPAPILLLGEPGRPKLLMTACLCGVASVVMFGFMLFWVWASARFVYEFTPLLAVLVFIDLSILWRVVRERPGLKRGFQVGLLILLFGNIAAGLMYGWLGMQI